MVLICIHNLINWEICVKLLQITFSFSSHDLVSVLITNSSHCNSFSHSVFDSIYSLFGFTCQQTHLKLSHTENKWKGVKNIWIVTRRTRSQIQAAEQGFVCGTAGLSLRVKVRSSVVCEKLSHHWKRPLEFSQVSLLRCLLGASCWRFSGHTSPGGHPWETSEPAWGIIYCLWPGNTSGLPYGSWRVLLESLRFFAWIRRTNGWSNIRNSAWKRVSNKRNFSYLKRNGWWECLWFWFYFSKPFWVTSINQRIPWVGFGKRKEMAPHWIASPPPRTTDHTPHCSHEPQMRGCQLITVLPITTLHPVCVSSLLSEVMLNRTASLIYQQQENHLQLAMLA